MDQRIIAAGHQFLVITEQWPFADDERACLDLIESRLRELDAQRLETVHRSLAQGVVDPWLARVVDWARAKASGGFADLHRGNVALVELRAG